MTPIDVPAELKFLGFAVVLGLVQVTVAAHAARKQQSLEWGAGPRDTPRDITGVAGRLDRAFKNFMETFPFFAAALLAATAAGRLGSLTYLGSLVYLGARVVYVPLYAAGIPYVRTVAWMVATGGLLAVVVALFS